MGGKQERTTSVTVSTLLLMLALSLDPMPEA
jgi:hypothetical protein